MKLSQKQPKYAYLESIEGTPKVITEALKLYGVQEVVGPKHNPVILGWAKTLGLTQYNADEIPWCGLFVAYVVKQAGYNFVANPLWARNWANFGVGVKRAALGDILVFARNGGGHVGFYVGEDANCFHVLGGNQSNEVNVTRILKSRCVSIRRCKFATLPKGVKEYHLAASGQVSTNEA